MSTRKQATTDTAVKNAKPETKAYKMGAGLGMYLLVNPSGSKLWRLKYRIDGKEKTLSFGAYPEISLADARMMREQAREKIAQGIDPLEIAKKEKQERQQEQLAEQLTFKIATERWLSAKVSRKNKPLAKTTVQKIRLYLNKDLYPAFGNTPLAEISRKDLVLFIEKIEKRGAFEPAAKMRVWLNEIFQEAFNLEEIKGNPAYKLKPSLYAQGREAVNHPTVKFNELPALLEAVDATKSSLMNKLAIRVMLLTAVRPGELRLATWKEFNFKQGVWVIPAERMKMRKEHTVPLPRQAVDALKELQALAGGSKYVLPNSKGVPISDATINKTFKLAGYGGKQTGHGFRHLLSTELNERGYNSDWIEAQLAHKVGGEDKIRGVYNHAVYLEQRTQMMQEWANSIDALIAGANVVAIKRAQK